MNYFKQIVSSILIKYIKQQKLKMKVKESILKHYKIIPIKTKGTIRIAHLHNTVYEDLRLINGNYNLRIIQEALKDLGVIRYHPGGKSFYKGIASKREMPSACTNSAIQQSS